MFLAAQGGGRKGDLSRFVEEAVRSSLLETAVAQAKTAAAGIRETELNDLIVEAVQWARELDILPGLKSGDSYGAQSGLEPE